MGGHVSLIPGLIWSGLVWSRRKMVEEGWWRLDGLDGLAQLVGWKDADGGGRGGGGGGGELVRYMHSVVAEWVIHSTHHLGTQTHCTALRTAVQGRWRSWRRGRRGIGRLTVNGCKVQAHQTTPDDFRNPLPSLITLDRQLPNSYNKPFAKKAQGIYTY